MWMISAFPVPERSRALYQHDLPCALAQAAHCFRGRLDLRSHDQGQLVFPVRRRQVFHRLDAGAEFRLRRFRGHIRIRSKRIEFESRILHGHFHLAGLPVHVDQQDDAADAREQRIFELLTLAQDLE